MSDTSRGLLSCRVMVRMFTDYLEDALPLDERLSFEEHLSLCDGCTSYLDQLRDVVRISGGLSADEVPEDLRDAYVRTFSLWKGRPQ